MPRGGSRKGEKRGGAKPSVLRLKKVNKVDDPTQPKRKRGNPNPTGRTAGSKNKPRIDPNVTKILMDKRGPMVRERELEMYRLVTGKSVRLPKDVMLDAMRYFEERAVEHGEVAQANLAAAAEAHTPEERQIYNEAAMLEEQRLREYVISAVDVAYKVAPFIHPRLAAVITKTGDDSNPASLLTALMRDLDEAGRAPRYLDLSDDEFERKANGSH